ncbi:MAG: CsgG/HfaB family protein [Pseudomonadota bacterium]
MASLKKITFLITLLFLIPALAIAEKNRIAVMDLRADGIAKDKALRISELIRTEIVNTGVYTVIERNQMDMVFKEQGIQQTGVINDAYAIKMGELLSAQKILIGTVMQLGDAIIISGRIVDIEKGIAEFAVNQSAANENELLEATKLFCRKLTGTTSQTAEISGTKRKKTSQETTAVAEKKSAETRKSTDKAAKTDAAGKSDVAVKTSKKAANIKPSIVPSKKVYAQYEQIDLAFSHFPGNDHDWISIAKFDEPENYYQTYSYTGSQIKEGTLSLGGLDVGQYEIRYYYDWENGKYDYHVMGTLSVSDK